MKSVSKSIIEQCLVVLLLLVPFAVCDQYPFCEDTTQEFEIITKDGQHSTSSCEWVKIKFDGCKLEDTKKHCPSTCEICQCTNNPAPFLIESKNFVGGQTNKTCSWVLQNPKERCGSDFHGTSENCPLYCGKCEQTPYHRTSSTCDRSEFYGKTHFFSAAFYD